MICFYWFFFIFCKFFFKNYLLKQLNSMFTWFSDFKFFRVIKSGFLLDFLIKKQFLIGLKLQFLIYNIFIEKYYVEFLFLRIKDYAAFFILIVDSYASEFVFAALSVFLTWVFFLIFFIKNLLTPFRLYNLFLSGDNRSTVFFFSIFFNYCFT